MDQPLKHKISVIIPVYNGCPYIAAAIDSVLEQDYPVHDIIVIDDGSTDETPQVLQKFGGKIIVKRTENRGVSHARNTGMGMASGDYLAFLDHDDIWARSKLTTQMEAVDRHPSIGLFCCNYFVRNPLLSMKITRHYQTLNCYDSLNFNLPLLENPFKLIIQENFIGTPSAVVLKKDVAKKVGGFNPLYKNAQDFDYWLRCATVTNFVVMSEALVYKRVHSGNLSGDPIRNFYYQKRVILDIFELQRAYIQKNKLKNICRSVLAEKNYYLGNLYFESSRRREAFAEYWAGLISAPMPLNWLKFIWKSAKKLARVLTRDTLSKKKLDERMRFLHPRFSLPGSFQSQKKSFKRLHESRTGRKLNGKRESKF